MDLHANGTYSLMNILRDEAQPCQFLLLQELLNHVHLLLSLSPKW